MDNPGVAEVLFTASDRHYMRPANIYLMMTAEGYKPITTKTYLHDNPYVANETVSAFKEDLLIDFKLKENDLQVKLDLDYNVRMAPREGKTSPMHDVAKL
jgi:protocatechuate 3,4-dioxygenase beta subunit